MIKVMFHQFLMDLRKNWLRFLVYTAAAFIAIMLMVMAVMYRTISELGSTVYKMSLVQLQELIMTDSFSLFGFIGSCALVSFLWLRAINKHMPIQLGRMLYTCAAGKRERMHYLKMDFALKCLLSCILLMLFSLFMFESAVGFLYLDSIPLALIQLSLWFFNIWDINLMIADPNPPKADIYSFQFRNKYEDCARFQWFALLLLENVIFYTMVSLDAGNNIWSYLIWALVFVGNCLLAKFCTSKVLSLGLSYERVYRSPRANKEMV